jgi:hypothetical protein
MDYEWFKFKLDEVYEALDRLEAMIPKSGSATSGVEHENKGDDMTMRDKQAAGVVPDVIRDMTQILRSPTNDADAKHAALSTLVEAVCPGWVMTQAASGGGEEEPDCWAVENDEGGVVRAFTSQEAAELYADTSDRGGPYTVVPRFRAPPQPRGWLTDQQTAFLKDLAIGWTKQFLGTADASYAAEFSRRIVSVNSILSRSYPPEVVLPPIAALDMQGIPVVRLVEVREALAAAGVPWKETK